jgi:hypothetical protein
VSVVMVGIDRNSGNQVIGVEMKKDSSFEMPLRSANVLKFPSRRPKEDKEKPIIGREDLNESVVKREFAPPPWLFQHQDLNNALKSAKVIDSESLKNKLNYVHFMDKHLLILLRHPKYDDNVIVKAKPGPCLGGELTCQFLDDSSLRTNFKKYTFLQLIIDDGKSVILIPANLVGMDKRSFSFNLPPEGYSVGQRRARRYPCRKADAELVQRGLVINGELLDYSPEGLCIRLSHMPSNGFEWSPGSNVLTIVHLRRDQQHFFSGHCHCIRQQEGLNYTDVVMVPAENQVQGFESEKVSKPAPNIPLTPVIIFDHPFFRKRIQLDVPDISTSGFSVYETRDEAVLMQGMIIHEVTIEFVGAMRMECSAQVTGRFEKDNKTVRCDFTILDMGINSYTRLVHILANSIDPHSRISNQVNMDELWEFFFESGFIYPEKYGMLSSNRKRFKETYTRLYRDNPEISKHFTYMKNGRIYGHISMIRAYERAWMIHHHAARSVEGRRAGFSVLKQIMRYLDDIHRLPSAKMDYAMSFFRPENKFPDRVFGGFARDLGNPRGCSMDLFTYLPYVNGVSNAALLEGWVLSECSQLDLWELDRFYSNHSGGLLIDAMGLRRNTLNEESLEEVYGRHGFLRKCRAFALKCEDELNAVFIVDQSDLGFNLSELLNGIKIVVVNVDGLAWDMLSMAIDKLVGSYSMFKVPILLYPFDYVEAKGVSYEKQYFAWFLNVRYGNEYMAYMQKKFRINYN